MFGTPVKGSMTNFKVGQMVKTTLHITGSVNGQHHFPDLIDSYCLFLSPFLQLQIITPSPQHYEHDEACSNPCHWGERERIPPWEFNAPPVCLSVYIIIGASVSEAPSCGLNGRAVTIDIYIYIYIYTAGTRYCACAALRANVAGRIWNRFSPAESAFLVPSATSLTLAP